MPGFRGTLWLLDRSPLIRRSLDVGHAVLLTVGLLLILGFVLRTGPPGPRLNGLRLSAVVARRLPNSLPAEVRDQQQLHHTLPGDT